MATWNAAFLLNPRAADTPTQGDDAIREVRSAVQERIKNEHTTYESDGTNGTAAKDWLHKAGSAAAFYAATGSAPATRLSGEALTAGMLWYDTTVDALKVWNGASWSTVASNILGATPRANLVTFATDDALALKIVEIGDWNMDSTADVSVAHGLGASYTEIRDLSVWIRDDGGTARYPLDYGPSLATQGWFYVSGTYVRLYRQSGYLFDSTDFNSTSYNRGWITIWYVP